MHPQIAVCFFLGRSFEPCFEHSNPTR
jgi:hypothetical protein